MLPLAERLRSNRQFQQVFAKGQSFSDSRQGLVALHVLTLPAGEERHCGFTVSKKVGNAIVRNKVKRRLREAYRARLPELPKGLWLVVVARSRAATADHAALVQALDLALGRAGLLVTAADHPPPP